jgi:hypothetical protein
LILESGALANIKVEQLFGSFFSHHISLFYWKGKTSQRSWALFKNVSVSFMNFPPPELFSECETWLKEELGFKSFDDQFVLDPTIKSYCRFLQRAHTHRLSGRPDEAFLHFIIALDLLFGLEGRSSENVGSRAAMLVHRQLDNTFDEQFRVLKKLYDRRSKYVHEGKFADHKDLEDAEKICTEILWCLLASTSAGAFTDFAAWLAELDYLIGAIKASKEISDDEMKALGIPLAGYKRKPPNRIIG